MLRKIIINGVELPHIVFNLCKIIEPCYLCKSHVIKFLMLN
jgi:hypothetical protein